MARVEVKKQRSTTSIEVWEFVLIRNTLYLDRYYTAVKDSTRHRKYHKKLIYNRLDKRGNNIEVQVIPLSEEIKQEALELYLKKVECKKWS